MKEINLSGKMEDFDVDDPRLNDSLVISKKKITIESDDESSDEIFTPRNKLQVNKELMNLEYNKNNKLSITPKESFEEIEDPITPEIKPSNRHRIKSISQLLNTAQFSINFTDLSLQSKIGQGFFKEVWKGKKK